MADNVLEFTMNEGPIERQHFKSNKMAFWDGVYAARPAASGRR